MALQEIPNVDSFRYLVEISSQARTIRFLIRSILIDQNQQTLLRVVSSPQYLRLHFRDEVFLCNCYQHVLPDVSSKTHTKNKSYLNLTNMIIKNLENKT